jgi:hypothetical protein
MWVISGKLALVRFSNVPKAEVQIGEVLRPLLGQKRTLIYIASNIGQLFLPSQMGSILVTERKNGSIIWKRSVSCCITS